MVINKDLQNLNDPLDSNQNPDRDQEPDYLHRDSKNNSEKDRLAIKNLPNREKQITTEPVPEKEPARVNDITPENRSTHNFEKNTAFSSEESSLSNSTTDANLEMIMDIPINIQIILGSCRMPISSLMDLSEGEIIALDKRIGELVDITVNACKIAKGEITIIEDDDTRFGIKLIEILNRN